MGAGVLSVSSEKRGSADVCRLPRFLIHRLLWICFVMSNYMNVLWNDVCHSNKRQHNCGLFLGKRAEISLQGVLLPLCLPVVGATLNKPTFTWDRAQVRFHPQFLSQKLRTFFFFSVRMSSELTEKKRSCCLNTRMKKSSAAINGFKGI